MKFTLSWLKRHLATEASLDEISARLTMLGIEVEGIDDPASRLVGFVTAHVLDCGPHPNADRLHVCRVDSGRGVLQVVCGAPNARAGLKVALALPGVVIPASGETLKKGVVRGIESQAMMCSIRELMLGDDHSGIIELPASTPPGRPLAEVLASDPVIDVAVTPNRADCLGVRGIARDLAASGLGRLKPLTVEPVPGRFPCPVTADLDFPEGRQGDCPLFIGRLIRGVKNVESPGWLKDLLTAVGLRPISALVDITNYFTLDLDRPLHVFDAGTLKSGLVVRPGREGEALAALNGKTYALNDRITVIADDSGVLSLGGVMGGEATGVQPSTTTVFVESALFDPVRTGATGRSLGLESDARYRFERGLDPGFVKDGAELATRMILEICGGEASDLVIAGSFPPPARPIRFRPARVTRLGGVEVEPAAMARIMEGLGCAVNADSEPWTVTPPSWRGDLAEEHDLVEEVLRVHGYDDIPSVPMPRPTVVRPVLTAVQKRDGWMRRALAARGLIETVTWSFLPSAVAEAFGGGAPELVLANPISADLDAMRPTPLPNLIAAAGRNADRGIRDAALFELGPAYHDDTETGQSQIAAGLRAGRFGPRNWAEPARPVDVFDAKADVLIAVAATGGVAETSLVVVPEAPAWYHPGRSGSFKLGNKVVAYFGEIHPAILAKLDVKGPMVGFEVLVESLPLAKSKATKAKALLKASPFHPVERDFAFVVDRDVPADAVLRAAKGADKALIVDALVFDLYEGKTLGEGKKSIAIQLTVQPADKTLTDAEIEALSAKVVAAVTAATGGTLRT